MALDDVNPRDTLVTGMGFSLPGPSGKVTTTADHLWEVVSRGQSCVENDGVYFGAVPSVLPHLELAAPEVPVEHLKKYSSVHLYGLLSMLTALEDADIDWRGGAASSAAVVTARSGVDTIVSAYRAVQDCDPDLVSPAEAKRLFMSLALSGTVTDVGNVQASLLRSNGPSFCVSCGCASSAVALGQAKALIGSGEVDLAVVTGVDAWDLDQARHLDRVRDVMKSEIRTTSFTAPALRLDRQMRPYDEHSDGFNMGDGSVTLVLESREHAQRRGHASYGEVLGQATRRSAAPSALATSGLDDALAASASALLDGKVSAGSIPYVNGGAQGDRLFNDLEMSAVRTIFGPGNAPLVTSQEACFGHVASALGNLGVATTLLMMRHGTVAPTAGCTAPAPGLGFDPVPGPHGRPLDFDLAMSFNYQVGGVASTLLLGADRG